MGEKIGLYASLCAMVELGPGALLHSLRIPLRGTFLSFLQGFMLTIFAKDLAGKGLVWISTVAAALKAFAPAGAKLKPMFFIALQGFLFNLPLWFFGVNFLSVVLGFFLLVLCSLYLPLVMDYIIFGPHVLIAYNEGVQKLFMWFGVSGFSLLKLLIILSISKLFVALLLASVAYWLNFEAWLQKLTSRLEEKKGLRPMEDIDLKRPPFRQSFFSALSDLLKRKFLLPFIFVLLLIYFFAGLSSSQFTTVCIRALSLSWFGFLLARRIDFLRFILFLETKNLPHAAEGLRFALKYFHDRKH